MVLRRFEVLAYDRAAALWVAERRSQLRWARRTVEHPDLCIAGVAGSLGMVLVSNNLRHFELLQGLEVEDWESANR